MHEDDPPREELRRIDHLVFVTLKYTRTVDIIRTILEKCILALDLQTERHFTELLEKNKIKEMPPVPLQRIRKLEHLYPKDPKIKDITDFYVQLKAVYNAEYKAKEEYRKNVALVTKEREINIATLEEYADLIKEYVQYLEKGQFK